MLYNVQNMFVHMVSLESYKHGKYSYQIVYLAQRMDLHCYKSIDLIALVF